MDERLKVEYVGIDTIKPYRRNAKLHPEEQVEQIKRSMLEMGDGDALKGFLDPIGVWNGEIVEGHGRYLAAQELGLDTVPIIRLDELTDEQRRAYGLIHNQLTMNSGFDIAMRDLELGDIELDMEQFGFDLDGEEAEPQEAVEDDYDPEPPAEPKAKRGDIYQLGRHRLVCGDSTDPAVIDRLMDGAKADMVFTDPPFGVNVKGGKDKGNMIMGDLTQTAIPFSFEIAVTKCTKDKAHFYFCGAEANIQLYQKLFDRYLHILPKHLIWVKNGFVMKQSGYHNQFEIIYHGYKQGSGGLWYGGRTEDEASDVWHINRDASSAYLHPTQKPIGVPARAIKNSCPPSGSVVDLFGGSGSTLIACEQLNRKCYMSELDPRYVDVIIDRWEKFTGKKAVLLNCVE